MAREMPEIPGVTHRDVKVNGLRIHVAEAGEGPPLLLLHGWPQHWWIWREVIPRLAPHHRLIMPDTRGFGWSEAPRRRLRQGAVRLRRAGGRSTSSASSASA